MVKNKKKAKFDEKILLIILVGVLVIFGGVLAFKPDDFDKCYQKALQRDSSILDSDLEYRGSLDTVNLCNGDNETVLFYFDPKTGKKRLVYESGEVMGFDKNSGYIYCGDQRSAVYVTVPSLLSKMDSFLRRDKKIPFDDVPFLIYPQRAMCNTL